MATLSITTHSSLSPWLPKKKNKNNTGSTFNKNPFGQKTHLPFSLYSKPSSRKPLRFSINKDELQESEPTSSSSSSSSSVAVVSEKPSEGDEDTQKKSELSSEELDELQEMDWKTDEEFKKFMGNPSIEAAIKLEKKRADRKLKELDRESSSDNPLVGFFTGVVRDSLAREKERLEKAEETFKALDLNKVIIYLIHACQ